MQSLISIFQVASIAIQKASNKNKKSIIAATFILSV